MYTGLVHATDEAGRRSRPHMPGYGVPTSAKGMLEWSHVDTRLERARHYWVATTDADGRPHSVPVDGVWLESSLYFGGGDTRWMRNLRANPRVAIHLESGDDVVIVEGAVAFVDGPDALLEKLATASKAKYGFAYLGPCWSLTPQVAFAWTNLTKDPTRWVFS